MYGMPSDFAPTGFDTSMLLMAGYLFGGLGALIFGAMILGILTLPVFFIILWIADRVFGVIAHATGWFPAKLVLIMFRGLRRTPLRTSLSYLALFVLTLVLCLIYAVLHMIGNATREKEANFKAIVTHKTLIPSQMPQGYYSRFKDLLFDDKIGLPKHLQPVNGQKDVISWSFVIGTTDKINPRRDTFVFCFALEPDKVMSMMDGLDELTGEEKDLLERGMDAMMKNPQAIIMSKVQMRNLNVQVGQRIKVHGINYKDITGEFDIIGTLPDGKYEGISFMNISYLLKGLDAYERANNKPHPMADKCINLIWVKLPTKEAFERLGELVSDRSIFNTVPIKLETASSGIGTWMASFKDIFWGMKYILVPAMIGIMCLVVANAISISVRERRTEMAVLKVLGFQPRHVMLLVLGEGLLVGFLAGGMASFLAWGMLGSFKFQIMFFGAFIVPKIALVYGPALGMTVSFAGSIIPAMTAKKVRVAEVFAKVAWSGDRKQEAEVRGQRSEVRGQALSRLARFAWNTTCRTAFPGHRRAGKPVLRKQFGEACPIAQRRRRH